MKDIKLILLSLIIINLYACAIVPERDAAVPEQEATDPEQNSARTLILRGKQFKESKPREFTSWKCSDYSYGGRTLVEVGLLPNDYLQQISDDYKEMDGFIKSVGFVLYDGTNTGEMALYQRRGINHRWDWGFEGSYSFIIKPDGTGLFYDFSTAKDGKKSKADDVYKCHR